MIPNTLDETNGTEAAGINIGNNDISYAWSPAQTGIPATGPVDFNGDGNETDIWCASGCTFAAIDLNNDGTGTDVLLPFEDWPNLDYQMQCTANYLSDSPRTSSRSRALIGNPSHELTTDEVLDNHLLYPHKSVQVRVFTVATGIAVAVLGAPDFDVKQIDLTSLSLHGAKPVATLIQDINHDGRPDLVVTFNPTDIKLHAGATRLRLAGWLKDGQMIFGEQRIVRPLAPTLGKEAPVIDR